MSGFKISTGGDLDTIFQTRDAIDPSAQFINYITADGKSLSERYLPYASGTKALTTGYKVTDSNGNTTDLSDYYMKILTLGWSAFGSGITAGGYSLCIRDIYKGCE